MSKRSTVLISTGVAVFIVGALLVLVSLHAHAKTSSTKANLTSFQGSSVVITTGPVAAGTTGETLVESNRVRLERSSAGKYSANDVTSFSQLEQQSVVHPLAAGTAIQTTDLSPSAGPLPVPKGDETVTVTLNSAASGLAGYLQPGDFVDVYGNVIKVTNTAMPIPCVALVAPKVQVLDVSGEVPAYRSNPTSTGRTLPSSMTVLLAITPTQAPTVVFYAANEQLYLVASNQTNVPASSTCLGMMHNGALVPVS